MVFLPTWSRENKQTNKKHNKQRKPKIRQKDNPQNERKYLQIKQLTKE